MSIKSAEAERLARRLAEATGETLTGAIVEALRQRLEQVERQQDAGALAGQLEAIAKRAAALPLIDARSPEEIIGYDENGVPR